MQPGVPNKPLPPQYQAPYSGGSSGRGCGCFALGCGGILLGLIALCGVGYYSLLYSNLPLAFMKRALEESGNVKIDGLKGNLSTGFEMASLRFKDNSLRDADGNKAPWSELNDIRIKYRNGGMFSSSFTVEEVRIGGGTLYGDLKFDSDLNGDLLFDELQEDFSDFQSEFSGSSQGTLAVQSISFTNLKITDPKTGEEFKIDEIRLDDVVIENGRLVEFGDLVVKADSIELQTERTTAIESAELERTFRGRLERGLVDNLLTDIPFEIVFAVLPEGKVATRSRWFDGKIQFDAGLPNEANRYRINGFSPAEHLKVPGPGIVATDIHVELTYDRERKSKLAEVQPDGYLQLGNSKLTKFHLQDQAEAKARRQHFLASTEVDGQQVEAEIYPLKRLPLIGVRLRKAGDWTLEETWAKTVFGKPFGELNDAERETVEASISNSERVANPPDEGSQDEDPRRTRSGRQRGNRDRENGSDEWPADDASAEESEGSWVEPDTADQPADESSRELEPAGKDGG